MSKSGTIVGKFDHEVARDREWSRLVAAAQSGDRAAYDQLLRQVSPFIRAIVARQQRAPDRVEDVLQDVLLTLHRVRHTYDPARSFGAWLAAIARRRSIDALRRRGRIDAAETADSEAYETFADPASNGEKAAGLEGAVLAGAIAALPSGQRQALELVKLREMSLAEASRITGKSAVSLKVNVHRALTALRARFKGE